MRTWKDVATLVKTKNLKGRFVARAAAGLPFLLEEGMRVAFVPPATDVPREGRVTLVRESGDDAFEVAFDTIADESSACALVGCHCLVRIADLGDVPLQVNAASWTDWRVETVRGEGVGEVVDLVENPGQALLEVARADGLKPVYIPLVDAFIVDVDEGERLIVVDLPDGLLDL